MAIENSTATEISPAMILRVGDAAGVAHRRARDLNDKSTLRDPCMFALYQDRFALDHVLAGSLQRLHHLGLLVPAFGTFTCGRTVTSL
jgi:hypothetical protein